MENPNELSIGQVAERAGLAASALRYYESAGLLPPVPRRNGQRRYPANVLQRLAVIRLAQDVGFSIAEIRTLLSGFGRRTPPSKRWQHLASSKLDELDERIRRTRAMRKTLKDLQRCECPTLDDCGAAVLRSESSG